MTIQVALMNGFGVAMASDRHVYRDKEARSTGQDIKLHRLRGKVPAAMMAAGPFAVFGLPVSRLAFRLEQALAKVAEEAGPEALAGAVLAALDGPLEGPPRESDVDVLADVATKLIDRAVASVGRSAGDLVRGLERVVAEIVRSPVCRDRALVEAHGRAAWEQNAPHLVRRVADLGQLLRAAPELCGEAVTAALSRAWGGGSDVYVTVGLCCPRSGVPALLALRLWRGLGGRLHAVSRLEHDFEIAWQAGRTVVAAQGSGRGLVEAMIDGLGEDHWSRMNETERASHRPALDSRWTRAHERLGVSTPGELAAIAAGLVRGAEIVGYLTRNDEGTVAPVDWLCLTPRGVTE